jgi:hypothetical protein
MLSAALIGTWLSMSLMPMPPAVDVTATGCPQYPQSDGCAVAPSTVYLAPHAESDDLLHEVGHLFDYQVMTYMDRLRVRVTFRDMRPWRSSPNGPYEKFAEAYAACAAGFSGTQLLAYRLIISERMLKRVCSVIKTAAANSAPSRTAPR